MSPVTKDLDVAFFDAIGLLVDLDDEKEMRARDVLPDIPICSHKNFREI